MNSYDYDLDGYDVVQQLSSRVLFMQTMYKSLDLMEHYQKRNAKVKEAFEKMKHNACGGKISRGVQANIRSRNYEKGIQAIPLLTNNSSQSIAMQILNQGSQSDLLQTYQVGTQAQPPLMTTSESQTQLFSTHAETQVQINRTNIQTQAIQQSESFGIQTSPLMQNHFGTQALPEMINTDSQTQLMNIRLMNAGSQVDIAQQYNAGSQANPHQLNAESQIYAPQLNHMGSQVLPESNTIGSQVYPARTINIASQANPQSLSAAVQAQIFASRNSAGNQWSEQFRTQEKSSRNPSQQYQNTLGSEIGGIGQMSNIYQGENTDPHNQYLSQRQQSVLDKLEIGTQSPNGNFQSKQSKSYNTKDSLEESNQQEQIQRQALQQNQEPDVSALLDGARTNGDPNQFTIAYQLQQAQYELTNYRSFLDELKEQTILRIENLTQIEISLAQRELASTSAGRQHLGKINQYGSTTNPFQPSSSLNAAQLNLQENSQKDSLALYQYEFENYRSQTEAYLISAQVQIESKRKYLEDWQKDLENKRQEIDDLYNRQMEFPLNCLQPNHDGIAWYIESMYQIEQEDLEQVDIFKNYNQDKNEQDIEFGIYFKTQESQEFMNKVDDLSQQYQNYGHQLSEEEFRTLMMAKAKIILKLEFEANKNKAKNKIVLSDLTQQKYALDEIDQHFKEKINERVISVELQRYLSTEMAELGKRQEAFSEVIKNIQTNYEQMLQEVNLSPQKSTPGRSSSIKQAGTTTKASELWQKSKNLNEQLSKMIKQNHEDQYNQDNLIKKHSKGDSLIDSLNSSLKLQMQIAKVSIDIDHFADPSKQTHLNFQATMTPSFLYNRFLNKDTWDNFQQPSTTQRISILKDMDHRISNITESQQYFVHKESYQIPQQNDQPKDIDQKLDDAHQQLRNNLLLNHNISKQSLDNFDKLMTATKVDDGSHSSRQNHKRNVSFGSKKLEQIDDAIEILENNRHPRLIMEIPRDNEEYQTHNTHNTWTEEPQVQTDRTLGTVISSNKDYISRNSKEQYSSKPNSSRQNYVLNENESFAMIPNKKSQFNDLAGLPIPSPDPRIAAQQEIVHPPDDSSFWSKEYKRQLEAFNSQNRLSSTIQDRNSQYMNDQAMNKFILNQNSLRPSMEGTDQRLNSNIINSSEADRWSEENHLIEQQQRFAQQLQQINNFPIHSDQSDQVNVFNPSPMSGNQSLGISRKETLKVSDRYFRNSMGEDFNDLTAIQEADSLVESQLKNSARDKKRSRNSKSPHKSNLTTIRSNTLSSRQSKSPSRQTPSRISKKSKSSTSPSIQQPEMVFGYTQPRIVSLKPSMGHKTQSSLQFKRKSPNSALMKRRNQRGRSPNVEEEQDEDDILGDDNQQTKNSFQTHDILGTKKRITPCVSPPEFAGKNTLTESYEESYVKLQEKEQKLFVLQENLNLETKYNQDLKEQLNQQLEDLKLKQENLKMLETDMNQQKLSLLIKFDKIKYLEDFYNYHKQKDKEELRLDVDIDQDEKLGLIEQVYLNHCKKVQIQETKRYWAINTIGNLLQCLIKKRNQNIENKTRFFLYFWKLQSMNKESQIDIKKRALILSASNETILKNGEQINPDDETLTWNLKQKQISFNGIRDLRQMTGKQLFKLSDDLHTDIKGFQKYRMKKIMNQMFLNQRRRARLLTYFAFQQYKTQVYKAVISDVFQSQEMSITPIKMFEQPGLPQSIDSQRQVSAHGNYSQDQMLDEVFGSGRNGAAASSQRTPLGITDRQQTSGESSIIPVVETSVLARLIKNQNKIQSRKQAAIMLQILTKTKRNDFYKRHRAFSKWKDGVIQLHLTQIEKADTEHVMEIEKLKEAHARTLNQFVISKQDLEIKLQKMAVLIRQKVSGSIKSESTL